MTIKKGPPWKKSRLLPPPAIISASPVYIASSSAHSYDDYDDKVQLIYVSRIVCTSTTMVLAAAGGVGWCPWDRMVDGCGWYGIQAVVSSMVDCGAGGTEQWRWRRCRCDCGHGHGGKGKERGAQADLDLAMATAPLRFSTTTNNNKFIR
jgi:hypothetical protein